MQVATARPRLSIQYKDEIYAILILTNRKRATEIFENARTENEATYDMHY